MIYEKPANEMTVREYYAGQALAGILANPATYGVRDEIIADMAFAAADAMVDKVADEELKQLQREAGI
jgi:hypothetical protein